jgi:hypothetical protein
MMQCWSSLSRALALDRSRCMLGSSNGEQWLVILYRAATHWQALAGVLEGLLLVDRAVYLAESCPDAQV